MTSTVGDLCSQILLESGIIGQGQSASAEDTNNCLRRLNQLISQWNRKRWLIFNLITVSFTSTGAISYTVGPGGNFNTPRPDRLENGCFFRQLNTSGSNQVDYSLDLIQSKENYDRITLKSMGTWPSQVFYDSAYPMGNAFIWPVPASGLYEIFLLMKSQITAFTGLSQAISLPPEYEVALNYNGQVRTRIAYRMPPDPLMIGLAKDSLNVLREANVQMPTLQMPGAVTNSGRRYNVFSDGYS